MANLLLLADVASKNSTAKPQTADAGVQTEFYFNSEDDGGRPFFQQCSGGGNSNETGGGNGNLFELPNLPPLHDYVKQTEFDYVVNAMHDYYNRLAPPDRELEHSYAVFGEDASDTAAIGNGLPDDGCFESIANLDEYMGIASQSLPDQSLLCEEIIDGDPLFVGGGFDRARDDLFDQLSICGVDVQTVVPLEELDVDELIQYIWPAKGNSNVEELIMASDPEIPDVVGGEPSSTNFDGGSGVPEDAPSASNTAEGPLNNVHPVPLRCQWQGCGRMLQLKEKDTFEKHILVDHLPRKKYSSMHNATSWFCQWDGCQRAATFSHRYQLLRHIRQHTMETPFQCQTCNRSFKCKEQLNIHERRAHNRAKEYICDICSKSFASTGDLSRHKRTHLPSATPNYVCGLCGAAYKDESGLRKHRKRIHKADG